MVRAEPAGQVGLGRGHRGPHPLPGRAQLIVACFSGQVGHGREQVELAHRVALDVARLAHRHPVLAVRLAAEQPVAVTLDEVAGQLQVAPLAGLPVQLDERGLHLRVPVDAVDRLSAAGRAEDGVDVVGEPAADLQQPVAAGGPVVRDGGLDQMPGAVQLVAPAQVAVAARAPARLEPAVEVAVGLLRVLDQPDDTLYIAGEPPGLGRVRVQPGQLPGCGLQPLVDVRVHERKVAAELARGLARDQAQIVQVSRGLQQERSLRDADPRVDLLPGGPEARADDRVHARTQGGEGVRPEADRTGPRRRVSNTGHGSPKARGSVIASAARSRAARNPGSSSQLRGRAN